MTVGTSTDALGFFLRRCFSGPDGRLHLSAPEIQGDFGRELTLPPRAEMIDWFDPYVKPKDSAE